MRYINKVSVLVLAITLIIQPLSALADPITDGSELADPVSVVSDVVLVEPSIQLEVSEESSLFTQSESQADIYEEVPVIENQEERTDALDITVSDVTVTTTPSVVDWARMEPTRARTPDPAAFEAKMQGQRGISTVPGELLVKYNEDAIDLNTRQGRRMASLFARTNNLVKKDEVQRLNISVLQLKEGKSISEKIVELLDDPRVESVQPNYQYRETSIVTSDTYRDQIWGLDNVGQEIEGYAGTPDADIDAPEAWAIDEGTHAPVIVAVIDIGVMYTHPDLAPNMWDGTNCKDENGLFLGGCNHGYDFEDGDTTPLPTYSSHGTHVAGTIAAVKDNGRGTIGVAPHAQIMALKTSLTTLEIIKSIDFAKQNGAQIINASWGGLTSGIDEEDQLLKDAIAGFPGLFVAASGNNSLDTDGNEFGIHFYPSDFDLPNIISVAATTQDDELASFSNYGQTSVDVGAPGTQIMSTVPALDMIAYEEDFEEVIAPALPDTWTKDATSTWGTFEYGETLGNVLYGDVAYPYTDNQNTVVIGETYPLMPGTGASMSFFAGCDTEYSEIDFLDYMQLEFSANGIDFTEDGIVFRWDEQMLDVLSGEEPLDSEGSAYYDFIGIPIPAEYATEDFTFRFRWVSNDVDNNHDGCFIDAVNVHQSAIGNGEDYAYSDGTSMATPHVAGLAALIQGYNPGLTTAEVKDIIMSTGDSLPSLATTTVSGKRVNAHRALQSAGTTKVINSFTIPSQVGDTQIDALAHTIALTMPANADITNLVPMVSFRGATISPAVGVAVDFTLPVTYTVTALDGSQIAYVVTVTKQVQIEEPAPQRSSGGGGGGGGSKSKKTVKVVPKATPVVSETVSQAVNENIIVPVSQNRFTQTIALGARGNDVIELQKILIAEKYLRINPPTGYYGPLTATAVRAYQRAHSLPVTGVVDTQTLAVLNGSSATTEDSKAQLIVVLMEKLKALKLQLAAIQQ